MPEKLRVPSTLGGTGHPGEPQAPHSASGVGAALLLPGPTRGCVWGSSPYHPLRRRGVLLCPSLCPAAGVSLGGQEGDLCGRGGDGGQGEGGAGLGAQDPEEQLLLLLLQLLPQPLLLLQGLAGGQQVLRQLPARGTVALGTELARALPASAAKPRLPTELGQKLTRPQIPAPRAVTGPTGTLGAGS